MLEDKICKKRDELNKSIETKQDYSITYKLSVELDELITQYYTEYFRNIKNEKNKRRNNKIIVTI